jgi:hypothetical protein
MNRLFFHGKILIITILLWFFPIKGIIHILSNDIVYDKVTVLAKKECIRHNLDTDNTFEVGTYVKYKHSDNSITYDFIQNPLIADTWEIGTTYITQDIIKGGTWGDLIALLILGVLYGLFLVTMFFYLQMPENTQR